MKIKRGRRGEREQESKSKSQREREERGIDWDNTICNYF